MNVLCTQFNLPEGEISLWEAKFMNVLCTLFNMYTTIFNLWFQFASGSKFGETGIQFVEGWIVIFI